MISSRKLSDLTPATSLAATRWLAECTNAGFDVLITSTYRDNESQNALYAQGRTAPGPITTNAKGGQSMHQTRTAIDFVPMKNGKCQWKDVAAYRAIGEIAERNGFTWSGRWTGTLKETCHIQLKPTTLTT